MCVRSLRSPGVIPWSHKLRPYTQRFCIRSIAHVPDIRPAERDARKCRRSSAGGLVSLKRQKKQTHATSLQPHVKSCFLMPYYSFFEDVDAPQFLQSCASRNDSRTDLQNMEGSPLTYRGTLARSCYSDEQGFVIRYHRFRHV